jgi:hypothetical protein
VSEESGPVIILPNADDMKRLALGNPDDNVIKLGPRDPARTVASEWERCLQALGKIDKRERRGRQQMFYAGAHAMAVLMQQVGEAFVDPERGRLYIEGLIAECEEFSASIKDETIRGAVKAPPRRRRRR